MKGKLLVDCIRGTLQTGAAILVSQFPVRGEVHRLMGRLPLWLRFVPEYPRNLMTGPNAMAMRLFRQEYHRGDRPKACLSGSSASYRRRHSAPLRGIPRRPTRRRSTCRQGYVCRIDAPDRFASTHWEKPLQLAVAQPNWRQNRSQEYSRLPAAKIRRGQIAKKFSVENSDRALLWARHRYVKRSATDSDEAWRAQARCDEPRARRACRKQAAATNVASGRLVSLAFGN
jgi:hypothetical protein